MAGLLKLRRVARAIHVERCEYVPVDPESSLLRVHARMPNRKIDLQAVTLVVRGEADTGDAHPQIAAPTRVELGSGEGRQFAFAVSTDVVCGDGARLGLALGRRLLVPLPAPEQVTPAPDEPTREEMEALRFRLERERSGRHRAEDERVAASSELAEAREHAARLEQRNAAAERKLEDLTQKLLLAAAASAELGQRLEESEKRAGDAEEKAGRLRASQEELAALLARQERDAKETREDLEEKLRLAGTESAGLRQRLEESEERAEAAHEDAERVRASQEELAALLAKQEREMIDVRENLQRRCDELAEQLNDGRADVLRAELAEARRSAHAQQAELRREIEQLTKSNQSLEDELRNARVTLEVAQAGRRGRLRKALMDSEAERARLESELAGLLLRVGYLEEALTGSPELATA